MLKLYLVHTKVPPEKKNRKKSRVGPGGSSSLKMIFAILTEVIAVYVQFTIIHL